MAQLTCGDCKLTFDESEFVVFSADGKPWRLNICTRCVPCKTCGSDRVLVLKHELERKRECTTEGGILIVRSDARVRCLSCEPLQPDEL